MVGGLDLRFTKSGQNSTREFLFCSVHHILFTHSLTVSLLTRTRTDKTTHTSAYSVSLTSPHTHSNLAYASVESICVSPPSLALHQQSHLHPESPVRGGNGACSPCASQASETHEQVSTMLQAVRPPKQEVSSVRLFDFVTQKQGFKTLQDSKQFLKRV